MGKKRRGGEVGGKEEDLGRNVGRGGWGRGEKRRDRRKGWMGEGVRENERDGEERRGEETGGKEEDQGWSVR